MTPEFLNAWLRAFRKDTGISTNARTLGLLVVSLLSATGKCDYSYSALSTLVGIARSETIRAMGELIESGWLGKTEVSAFRKVNQYELAFPSSGLYMQPVAQNA